MGGNHIPKKTEKGIFYIEILYCDNIIHNDKKNYSTSNYMLKNNAIGMCVEGG